MAVEMVPGGKWLLANGVKHYVTHPEHIKRLLSEGAEPIADPRVPNAQSAPVSASVANEDTYKQRIAELEALLATKQANDAPLATDEKPVKRGAR